MKRRTAFCLAYSSAAVVAAVVAVACSNNSTSPHVATPCPTYSAGSATPAALQGGYTLVSFCEDTLPVTPGVTGSLTMTVGTVDSFIAMLNVLPAPLAGPYSVSHDTITVTLPNPLGTFVGTYKFVANAGHDTLSVSGHLPGNPPPPIAIVFAK